MFAIHVQHSNPFLNGRKRPYQPMAGPNNETQADLIAELEAIGSKVLFNPGERILTEGEAGKGIYILHSGSAKVSMATHTGEIVDLRTLEQGSFIGLSSTLSCDHCCYSVDAAEPCEFTFIPAERAQDFLRSRSDLCLQVIQLLGHEMSSLCNERALLNVRMQPIKIST
jgi:CRP-like cAMP-binding protein